MEWKSTSCPTFNRIKMISLHFCRHCVIATVILKDTILAHPPCAHILSHFVQAVTLWSWDHHSHAAERRHSGTFVTCPMSHTSKWSKWSKSVPLDSEHAQEPSRERSRGPGIECRPQPLQPGIGAFSLFLSLSLFPFPAPFLLPFTLFNKCFLGTHSVSPVPTCVVSTKGNWQHCYLAGFAVSLSLSTWDPWSSPFGSWVCNGPTLLRCRCGDLSVCSVLWMDRSR